MKRSVFLFLLLLPMCPAVASAQSADSLSVEQRRLLTETPVATFGEIATHNAAMRYRQYPFSLTTTSLNHYYDQRGDATLVQEGTASRNTSLEVESFVQLSNKSRAFGQASYRNGRREDVRWNENSDFSLIYPYVTGDSIGGFMKEEEYRFMGGYAHRLGAWTLGGQLAYRASIAYRDKDPRPRNVVSDLEASMALARLLNRSYTIGTSVHARKYTQDSSISFLADKGATSVSQMLGMGVEYIRFAGTQTSTRHAGTGMGGSVDLSPTQGNGFSASLRGDYFHFVKELNSLNYAPMVEATETTMAVDLAWTKQTRAWYRGLKIQGVKKTRNGTENIFGDASGNVYPQISSVQQYRSTAAQLTLSGMVGQPIGLSQRTHGWVLLPQVGYESISSEHKEAARRFEASHLRATIELQWHWQLSKLLFTTGGGTEYLKKLRTDGLLPGITSNSSSGKALLSNIQYLSDSHVTARLFVRADYELTRRYALFLSAAYRYQHYQRSGETHAGTASLGFLF